jgi:hypothetical protein
VHNGFYSAELNACNRQRTNQNYGDDFCPLRTRIAQARISRSRETKLLGKLGRDKRLRTSARVDDESKWALSIDRNHYEWPIVHQFKVRRVD